VLLLALIVLVIIGTMAQHTLARAARPHSFLAAARYHPSHLAPPAHSARTAAGKTAISAAE
jgi:hypothetical protein